MWETDEPLDGDANHNKAGKYNGTWSTPVIAKVDGRDQLVAVDDPAGVVDGENPVGDLTVRLTGDVDRIGDLFITLLSSIVPNLVSSLVVSGLTTALTMLFAVPAAYALARFEFVGKSTVAFVFMSFRFVPFIAFVIPLYLLYQKFGLYNTHGGLIRQAHLGAMHHIVEAVLQLRGEADDSAKTEFNGGNHQVPDAKLAITNGSGGILAAMVFMLGGAVSGRMNHTGIIIAYGIFPLAI